jgi:hypothetical protein
MPAWPHPLRPGPAARVLVPLVLVAACTTPIQRELDAQVNQLCAQDGGIKVYETVALPATRFNQYGQVNFFRPTQGENSLGPEYLFKRKQTYYRQGNPEMSRVHIQIMRRTDDKLLGELVRYGRGGGDFPSPMHGTSYSCPNPEGGPLNALLESIFIKQTIGSQ